MKLVNKILTHALPLITLFLLCFIPLYPKLPLIDIKNTWVYIRVEDFLVLFAVFFWFVLLLRREVTLKTPLTIPILAFWIVGAIVTIHGVVIIFPTIATVFPNVALLAYLRHIEYLSVFFVAYSATKNKKFVLASIWTVVITLLLVTLYGFGQKYLSFPAYLTMNEEYAKGIPIIISPLNRISSTFAGHYDLAAYLVLIIPILASLFFGFKNLLLKAVIAVVSLLGVVLLFMTVSRVSFFVLFIALFFVLWFQKRKLVFIFLPFILLGGLFFAVSNSSLIDRFGNTVREVDVLVDAQSGSPVGQVTLQPRKYFAGKTILDQKIEDATPSGLLKRGIIRQEVDVPPQLTRFIIPKKIGIVQAKITSTGETLPQGSSYINLSLSPVTGRLNSFFFEFPPNEATTEAQLRLVPGDYLVKRASAYDLSFTTRFQGEWPHALMAFGKNILFGSGYGSVSLAVDNNYYRMLGETGLLGTAAFLIVFVITGIYINKMLPTTESRVIRSFAMGFGAGLIGLSLNAVLIDVFEASKVAFVLWILTGLVVGALSINQSKHFNTYKELLKAAYSPPAFVAYFLLLTVAIFSTTLVTYFSGDDFIWFRWAADCRLGSDCTNIFSTVSHYFLNSDGFFYRPGTKTYFLLMYPLFWLNQVIYHFVSLVLHFVVVILLYQLARKIFKNEILAAGSAFLFLILSSYLEVVLWVAGTGHLFNAIFILASLLAFIKWDESKNKLFLVLSLVAALLSVAFHELGIITPFLAAAYKISIAPIGYRSWLSTLRDKIYALLFVPVILYLVVRLFAHTHWFNGDYAYNPWKFPFNAIGNAFGYALISAFGPLTYPFYEKIRDLMKTNIPVAVIFGLILIAVLYFAVRFISKKLDTQSKKVAIFAVLFFLVCLIPFLGLGNITFRYSYLASFGIVMLIMLLISKLYKYLLTFGRDVAVSVVIVIFLVFSLVHIIQAQQAMIEWRGAGSKVEKFITSLDSLYEDSWSQNKVDLYFANAPLKNGNAWIFPLGSLEDSVWFAFKNDNIVVHTVPMISDVPSVAFDSPTSWVYEFQGDGSLIRVNKEDKK